MPSPGQCLAERNRAHHFLLSLASVVHGGAKPNALTGRPGGSPDFVDVRQVVGLGRQCSGVRASDGGDMYMLSIYELSPHQRDQSSKTSSQ